MLNLVDHELKRFASFKDHLSALLTVETPIAHSYILRPETKEQRCEKSIALTVLGIIHGNEVAGLAVINYFLQAVVTGVIKINMPMAIVLGNVEAARKGVRFLGSDLNRAFSRQPDFSAEAQRASEIATILDDTMLLLDIHQTKEPGEKPFFIFPYTSAGFAFAKHISNDIPLITHWGDPFSAEGMCTDEYVNSQGGAGITIEIGQNGFGPFHVSAGFFGLVKSLIVAQHSWQTSSLPEFDLSTLADINTYTFAQIIDFPEKGDVKLEPGFINFTEVRQGQLLAEVLGQKVMAHVSGPVLFPQYMRHGEKIRPTELMRVMRKISVEELPKTL